MRSTAQKRVAPARPPPWHAGTAQAVGSNNPFLLDGADAAWMIDAGAVDVFAVQLDGAGEPRDRQHLFTATAGEVVCGFEPLGDGAPAGILAVATADSAVRRIAGAQLFAPPAEHVAAAAALVDGWVSHLASALVAALRPRSHGVIHPGDEQTLAAGASVSSSGATWVEVVDGELWLDGDEALPPVGAGLAALAGRAWLTARTPATLRGHGTRALIGERRLATALAGFHQLFLRAADLRRTGRAAEHERRLAQQRRRDRRLMAGSLASLASLLARRPTHAAHDETPEYAACRLVCAAAGVELGPPPPGLAHHPDPIGLIIDDSRLRLRRIALREGWWRHDVGPLLGYGADGRPLALLPRAGGYELHDVVHSVHRRLTPEAAAGLAPSALMFYRRLPPRAIGAREFLAFAMRGCSRDLVRIALVGIAAGALTVATPLATGLVFDSIIPGAARGQLLYLALGLLVGAVASGLFEITRSLSLLRLEGRTGAALQAAVWDRLIDLPVSFFRDQTAGDLADRAAGVDTIRHDLSANLVTMVLATGFGLVNAVLLFYLDLSLGLWAAMLFAVPVVVAAAAAARLIGRHRAATQLQGRLAGLVLQLVRGITKLRVAGAEVRAYARWAELLHRQRWLALRTRAPLQVFAAVYPIAATLLLYTLILGHRDGTMTTGAFIAFMSAFNIVLYSLLQTAGSTLAILHVIPTFHRLAPILATRAEIDERKSDPGELDGEIEIAHVSFRYAPGTPYVLGDVSLHIRPGEFVAIVGPSGSGKSSLLRLLLGFERPTAGHVYYSGQDLEHVDLRKVRRQIGVVLQTSQLMPGDIFTNVVGSSELGRDEAIEALRMAGFGPDLAALPMGLHTLLSEGGSTLSGGQRQRLLIARAIVKRPRILYFDEATSALDNETQAHVSDSIEKLEATRVVVAHRLSTIIHADRIVVLDHGRVVQSGTYAELIAQPGVFAELARRQLL
ncbi:MAG TPA: NHLP bacteriocin export ABC transporter permease/ATPase subunit [Kofleriaceae bacterium]|nr:NHLP bacteriocin export ABC transporter permease/ATPase subunit [Kofleriaceae bacterium]